MVLPKLFSFKSSYSSASDTRQQHQQYASPPPGGNNYHHNHNNTYDDYDDNDTIGDDTIGDSVNSEGTMKSILRRNPKRNTDRSVSWSNTFDTYEEGGVDLVDTFETLQTYEQGGVEESRQDLDNMYEERSGGANNDSSVMDNNLIQNFNYIYPGGTDLESYDQETTMSQSQTFTFDDDDDDHTFLRESVSLGDTLESVSVSVSEDLDGAVEMEHLVSPRQEKTPPLPPMMEDAPRQMGRKQLVLAPSPTRKELRNLACASDVSDGTLMMMGDKYGGMDNEDDDEDDEENDMQVGNANKAVQEKVVAPPSTKKKNSVAPKEMIAPTAPKEKKEPTTQVKVEPEPEPSATTIKPSDIFLPQTMVVEQQLFPNNDSDTFGSLSMDDSIIDIIVSTDTGDNSTFASFDDNPGWDNDHIRAASDDESIASLTKREHSFESKQQRKADESAGHIGLILPQSFLGKALTKIQWPSMNMFESWDGEALKNDLMNGGSNMSSTEADSKVVSQDASSGEFSDKTEDSNGEEDGIIKVDAAASATTESTDAVFVTETLSGNSASNDGEVGTTIEKIVSNDFNEITEKTPEESQRSIEEFDIKNNSSDEKKAERTATTLNENKDGASEDGDDDVPSDDSTEVNSAQLSSDDELSMHEEEVMLGQVGQVIDIQELDKSNKSKKKKKKDKKRKNKKNRKKGRRKQEEGSVLWQQQLPQVVILDPSTVASEDVFITENQEVQNNNPGTKKSRAGKQQRSSGLWGRKKKSNNTSKQPKKEFSHIQDIFHPTTPSTPGKVYDHIDNFNANNADDDNMSIVSQASSCITTESILSELRVIENTAKMMYQQMVLSPESGKVGASHNNISALFSSSPEKMEEMELVLDESKMRMNGEEPLMGDGSNQRRQTKSNREDQEHQEDEEVAAKKKKRGGKFGKFFGRFFSSNSNKKKWRLGPFFGMSATWTPKDDQSIHQD